MIATIRRIQRVQWSFVGHKTFFIGYSLMLIYCCSFLMCLAIADLPVAEYGVLVVRAQRFRDAYHSDFNSYYPDVVITFCLYVMFIAGSRIIDEFRRPYNRIERAMMAKYARFSYSLSRLGSERWLAVSSSGDMTELFDWDGVTDFILDVEDSHASNAAHHLNTDTHSPVA